jgi:uncharacterized membrane protein
MINNRFSRPFFITGILAILPFILFFAFSKSLKSYNFNIWEIYQITATYFAMFGAINLIMSFGYWMKTKGNIEIPSSGVKRNLMFSIAAFVVFGLGALVARSIGQYKFGGFVAISLLLNVISLIMFIANMIKAGEERQG